MAGLYVHIPFCESKCGYCDFHSVVADDEVVDAYMKALAAEAGRCAGLLEPGLSFSSLYVGGGTPTRLSEPQLEQLFRVLYERFDLAGQAEITVEMNPNSITRPKARLLANLGVNRASIGAQACQDWLLSRLGRGHSAADIEGALVHVRDAGILRYSLDLMFALPGQTMGDWNQTLQTAVSSGAGHISCYSLTLEAGTPFGQAAAAGSLELPDSDKEAAMYERARSILTDAGFEHYEIANFARQGHRSVHNSSYWTREPYLGLGSGAHSLWRECRWSNFDDLERYICRMTRGLSVRDWEHAVTEDEAADETMWLGLRLLEGVSDTLFQQRFGVSLAHVYAAEVDRLCSRGLVRWHGDALQLTERGVSLGNQVFSAFLRE